MILGPSPSDIRRMLEQVRAAEPQIREAARQMREFNARYGATIREMSSWYFDQIAKVQPYLDEAVQHYARFESDAHRRIVPVLRRRGWFAIAPHLGVLEISAAVGIFDSRGAIAFDKFLCKRFSIDRHRRLKRMARSWWNVRYLKSRKAIVRAAIRAHAQGEYSLAVSTLLPLADGLAAAYFRKNPSLAIPRSGKTPIILVRDAARHHKEVRVDHVDLLNDALEKQVYQRYKFGTDRTPSSLNRHGILHGEISKFGTEKNSLRTFLLIDALSRVAQAAPVVP